MTLAVGGPTCPRGVGGGGAPGATKKVSNRTARGVMEHCKLTSGEVLSGGQTRAAHDAGRVFVRSKGGESA